METSVSRRRQTVIPAEIRRRHQIREGDRLVWLDDGRTIRVVPAGADPIAVLRGCGKSDRLLDQLLAARRQDRESES